MLARGDVGVRREDPGIREKNPTVLNWGQNLKIRNAVKMMEKYGFCFFMSYIM